MLRFYSLLFGESLSSVLKAVPWPIMVHFCKIVTWMKSCLIDTHTTSSYIYRRKMSDGRENEWLILCFFFMYSLWGRCPSLYYPKPFLSKSVCPWPTPVVVNDFDAKVFDISLGVHKWTQMTTYRAVWLVDVVTSMTIHACVELLFCLTNISHATSTPK